MWDGEGLERRSERWICSLLSSAFILESHWFSAAVLNQGDTRTFRVVTEAIPRRTKSRDEIKFAKQNVPKIRAISLKDWKRHKNPDDFYDSFLYKNQCILKRFMYLYLHTLHYLFIKMPYGLKRGREGESYNYSIYFTGHLCMFYNMVNISKQLNKWVKYEPISAKILPMIWTKNFGICILCILSRCTYNWLLKRCHLNVPDNCHTLGYQARLPLPPPQTLDTSEVTCSCLHWLSLTQFY